MRAETNDITVDVASCVCSEGADAYARNNKALTLL